MVFKIGQRVVVPSGMGGSFDAMVLHVEGDDVQVEVIQPRKHGDFGGIHMVIPADKVRAN